MRGNFIYLPPFLSPSTSQTAHSAVARLSFPAEDDQSLEACHQRSFESDFMGPCSHARCWFDCPISQALLVLATQALFHSVLVWSSHSRARRTLLLCTCLTVLPRRIPPCRLFDLITMPPSCKERGWVTLCLMTRPHFPLRCLLYVCQLFLH